MMNPFLSNPPPYQFSKLDCRSITQENPTGAKGAGGKGRGNGNCRKGKPYHRDLVPGEERVLADIEGTGMICHIWFARPTDNPLLLRNHILRIYWDGEETPSVDCPIGDFFGVAHGRTSHFMSPWIGMPQGKGFQCYFPMPFKSRCLITYLNESPEQLDFLFYQVDYTLGDEVNDGMGRFHAHFRRSNPCPVGVDYQLLETGGSPGVFVGAAIGVNPLAREWWGEGEMKFYLDGDEKYPTICGTGAEDYIGTGWGMGPHEALYTGVNYKAMDPATKQGTLFSFYRFHVLDPIYFQDSIRVELQQIGTPSPEFLREHGVKKTGHQHDTEPLRKAYEKHGWVGPHVHPGSSDWLFDRSDDYCSVAYWYQQLRDQPLPTLPTREERIKGIEVQPWEQSTADQAEAVITSENIQGDVDS